MLPFTGFQWTLKSVENHLPRGLLFGEANFWGKLKNVFKILFHPEN